MPWVLLFYFVGTLSISGAPFFNGYVSKTLLLKSAEAAHLGWLEVTLLAVAVGTFLSIGCKLAYFAFFGPKHTAVKESPPSPPIPFNMHLAMAITSLLCVGIGLYPKVFLNLLPYPEYHQVYDLGHIIHSLQLLIATFLGFYLILKLLHTKETLTLDMDWFYRKGAGLFVKGICLPVHFSQAAVQQNWTQALAKLHEMIRQRFKKQSIMPLSYPLLWMSAAFLLVGLALIFLRYT